MRNHGGLSLGLMDQCRAWSTVDQPPWPSIELDGAWPSGRSVARWLTGGGATGRGVHGESISGLTGARAAVWRSGNSGEEMVEEALSAGRAWAQREEKESRERYGEDRVGHHPFIRGRRGAEASGLHGRRQCLDLKAPVTRVKRGRGCDCGQLMRG
jgi:hypothetical protein